MQSKNIKITGMHCQGCKNLIESEIKDIPGVNNIVVDYQKGSAQISYADEKSLTEAKNAINNLGYDCSYDEAIVVQSKTNWSLVAGVALSFSAILFLLNHFQAFNLLAALSESNISLPIVFVIGILASFHCVGMCGGFVASYSLGTSNNNSKPHLYYNLGRIISYSFIGVLLGAVGSIISIGASFSGILLALSGLIMIGMGASLLSNNSLLRKMKIKTPDFIGRWIYKNKGKSPLIIGLATGLMPCGPLQAMQLYALSTGSPIDGGSAMLIYALGTTPLLFGLGKYISYLTRNKAMAIFKFSGVIVIFLGIMTFGRGISGFENNPLPINELPAQESSDNIQVIYMDVTPSGYRPKTISIKKDIPVRWIIRDKGINGCTDEIILYLNGKQIRKKLDQKENIIEFTPTGTGEIKFSCWMKMVWGKFVIDGETDKDTKTDSGFVNKNCFHTKDGLICN